MPILPRRRRHPEAALTAADGETVPVAKAFGVPAGAAPPRPIGDLTAARARLSEQTNGGNGGPIPPEIAAAMEAQGFDPAESFSPGEPIQPWYGYSRTPRAWDLPTGWNITSRPRASISRASFDTLKALTSVGTPRLCIEHRIDALRSYDWRLVPAEGEEGNVDDAIEIARRMLKRPDGRNRFAPWLAMLLEDLFRYDAPALFRRRDRAGRIIGLEVVSGATVAPLLDYQGRRPVAPAPAFVQYANGLPWDWLTDRDLIYEPFRPQPDSPYGVAPIEAVIIQANSDMRLAQHLLQVYTDGSIPGGIAEAPVDLSTPEQIEDFQAAWNAFVEGDPTQKVKIRWAPNGTNLQTFRPEVFDEPLALWFTRLVCASYAVLPQSLGLTQDVNRATAQAQMDIGEQIGDEPLAQHIEGIISSYLQDDLLLPVQFEFDLGRDKEDRLAEAQAWQIGVELGAAGVDEMRDRYFGLPVDPSRPVPRFIDSKRLGPIPLDALFRVAGPVDTETQAPADVTPLPTGPFVGALGAAPSKPPGAAGFEEAPLDPDEPNDTAAEHVVPGTSVIPAAPVAKATVRKDANKGLLAAGVVVRAADTGRILMLQRALDDTDPAAGTWEFPGGHIEDGETAWAAAWREWQEETGCPVPAGSPVGDWTVGIYQGFVWEIPSEADVALNPGAGRVLNPDDPDGDCIEVCAWWSPADAQACPALRPECRTADWPLIASGPVLKDMTAGVTSATGITGVNLAGAGTGSDDLGDVTGDSMADEVERELRRWRDNARGRIRKQQTPRPFTSTIIPAPLAATVWEALEGASSREQVDAAFEAVRKDRRPKAPRPDRWAGHDHDLPIVAHYAPLITQALTRVFASIFAAARAALEHGNPLDAANGPVDTTAAEAVLRDLWADAWAAGTHAAAIELADASIPAVDLPPDPVDWSQWRPGHLDAAALAAHSPGLAALLAEAGIVLRGIAETTVDRLGEEIGEGLARGENVASIAARVEALSVDKARAELIAVTETARAMSLAAMGTYRANNVPAKRWLDATGACPICATNKAAGVIPLDMPFPSGVMQSPQHPRCRCAVAPARFPTGDARV